MKKLLQVFRLLLFFSVMTSCTDDVVGKYSTHRAFFRYANVITTPPLLSALNNPGMYCKITFPVGLIRFSGSDGRTPTDWPRTAADNYRPPVCFAGFLVGTPQGFSNGPVAYDLVCPNCYKLSGIRKATDFGDFAEMKCEKCGRVYDLLNDGMVKSGEKGISLFRYHMQYNSSAGTLLIQN